MSYKLTLGLKKNKKVIIIGLVLWAILTIVLVLPFTVARMAATTKSGLELSNFIRIFGEAITNPVRSIQFVFAQKLIGEFFSNLFTITIIYLIFFIIGFVRTMPKHQYDNIDMVQVIGAKEESNTKY